MADPLINTHVPAEQKMCGLFEFTVFYSTHLQLISRQTCQIDWAVG